jgi:hypothetical protein
MSVDQFPLWGCGELLGSNARVFCCGVEHVTGYMVLCIALGPGSFCPKTQTMRFFHGWPLRLTTYQPVIATKTANVTGEIIAS